MRVLITDGNERAALAATRALGGRGLEVIVGAEQERSLAGASKYCRRSVVYSPPLIDPIAFVGELLGYIKRYEVQALFPVSEIAMQLACAHADEFRSLTALPVPSLEAFTRLSDKCETMKLASKLGIPIPETVYIAKDQTVSSIEHLQSFPVVVKPCRSTLLVDGFWRRTSVHYVSTLQDLQCLYRRVDYLREPSLIQPRIDGQGQGIFVLMRHGEPIALFAHKRIREKPPSGGVSVLRESIALPQPMTQYAIELLKAVRWHGVAMVEFKVERSTGTPFLMEVNGRLWGSLQLAVDSGVDFPFLLYQLGTGAEVPAAANGYEVGNRLRWFLGDVDHLLTRLTAPASRLNLPAGTPSARRCLWDFFRSDGNRTRHEILRAGDLGPFRCELSQYLAELGKGALKRMSILNREGLANQALTIPSTVAKSLYTRLIFSLRLQEALIYKHLPRCVTQILIVCTGNICRSPLAAVYMQARLAERKRNVAVRSAGLVTTPGKAAHPLARLVAEKNGLRLESHVTTRVSAELVSEADLILVMEPSHRDLIRRQYPDAEGKVFELGHFGKGAPLTIDDPYRGTREDFDRCFEFIKDSLDTLLNRLEHT